MLGKKKEVVTQQREERVQGNRCKAICKRKKVHSDLQRRKKTTKEHWKRFSGKQS